MKTLDKSTRLAFSVDEAAEIIGVSRAKLYQLFSSGLIARRKIGSRTVILADDLARFLGGLPPVDPAGKGERR